uniref:Uncharacterized protein n=1 Tax=Euplotes crassus TaxID=5936 RepID=A0A7S3NYR9_EUPCR|mmetsp:Transcript_7964/g.7517  ORF Transcript_7964/g.7517 Transcript_7964/m.7517 type:complete len:376 (+) Transcript_7964:896-2023(+)
MDACGVGAIQSEEEIESQDIQEKGIRMPKSNDTSEIIKRDKIQTANKVYGVNNGILVRSSGSMGDTRKKNPSIIYNENVMKIEIGNKNSQEYIELSEPENPEYANAMRNLYKLQSMSSSDGFYRMGFEYRPLSSGYISKSHLPMMHKVELKFEDEQKNAKSIKRNKFNALQANKNDHEFNKDIKNKMIVWDAGKKKWTSTGARDLTPNSPLSDDQKDRIPGRPMIKVSENIPAPVQKIDSISSEDAYNLYSSFYKNLAMNNEGTEDKEISANGPGTKSTIEEKEEVIPVPQFPPDMDPEEITTAFLYDLVNRVNHLPVTNKKPMIKSSRAGHRLSNNTTRRVHLSQPRAEVSIDSDTDQIKIVPTAAPIECKFSI